jgi:outer membrane receptor protein involved in Fe transport
VALLAQDDTIDEIVVVGSQIRGAQISEVLPVSVLSEQDIEALGVNSGDELLEFMAEQGQNFFSESENISGGVNSARGDIGAFNLRNLGTGNTLVLLNGRRMVNSAAYQTEEVGGSFVPVNTVNVQSLPVTGLRRAEVLREGASAIYGADAVAGVVNYVLKNDFEGFRVNLRSDAYESIGRQDERFTLQWGTALNDGATQVGAFFNYYERDRVNSQDDPRWANSDYSSLVADTEFAGTIFRNDSANSAYGQYDIRPSVSRYGISGKVTDSAGEFETYPAGSPQCQYSINDQGVRRRSTGRALIATT